MKVLNRGYIAVRPKQPFLDWANQVDEDFEIFGQVEPVIYLVEEDFIEEEPIIKKHYKDIFHSELLGVSEDENCYPEINLENFENWFELELGNTVVDLL